MPNRNYIKGRRKEYSIRNNYLNLGFDIVQRTAGSHSKIDIFAISKEKKEIVFIQSKPDNFSKKKAEEIKKELDYLNNTFKVSFILI